MSVPETRTTKQKLKKNLSLKISMQFFFSNSYPQESKWETLAFNDSGPGEIYGHSCVLDEPNDSILCFGGCSAGAFKSKLHSYHIRK